MTPEQLHRSHLKALAAGDIGGAAHLRRQFSPVDRSTAVEYLRATTAVCLEYRFGPGAGLGAGPADPDTLRAFMNELRAAGRTAEPPPDFLAVESAVRSLYGEPHLLEPLSRQRRSTALYTVLVHQIRRHPWLAANLDPIIDRAQQLMKVWVLG